MEVYLLLGFDTEAPFDQPYDVEDIDRAIRGSLEIVSKLNNFLNSYDVSRTFFLLGRFIAEGVKRLKESTLKEMLDSDNPLADLQSHGYSHTQFRAIPTDPSRLPLNPAEVYEDVLAASDVLHAVLRVTPSGLRTPRGYALGLNSEDQLIENIQQCHIGYVSSDLRDRNWQICTSLFDSGKLRQPRQYFNGLWELPSHGWQDMAFSGLKIRGVPDFAAMGKIALDNFIFSHYRGLMDEAYSVSEQLQKPIYIGTCLHPQAIQVYDPDLEILGRVLDFALSKGVRVSSYTAAYQELAVESRLSS